MKFIHPLAWLSLIGVFLFDSYQYITLSVIHHMPGNLTSICFMPTAEAKQLLVTWSQPQPFRGTTLLHEAQLNTRRDFLFIVGYVSVLTILSYNRMQRTPRIWLNTLLRLNFVLIIFAALCDVIKNFILLWNMAPYNIAHCFCSPY